MAAVALALFAAASVARADSARAEDAAAWLARAAAAARQLNYTGTIVYQHGVYVETSRLIHLYDGGEEYDKLVTLEGPQREVIRSHGEVRCFYADAKLVRVEPRTLRNAFPSLSPEQQKALADFYNFRKAESARVAGFETQAWVFEPKDGLRYGHKFWTDVATGLILKALVVGENNAVREQFVFSDVAIGAKLDMAMVTPTWPQLPPGWKVRQLGKAESETGETGWTVTRVPPGFVKIVDGYRHFERAHKVAHLVYSDGLTAVSVFIEPGRTSLPPNGFSAQSGFNVYSRQIDDSVVTVLGQVPALTVRQIGNAVARRERDRSPGPPSSSSKEADSK
ncbi:MAG TPA: MucB/RseB C-terminal domain-containing protein [Casimicrobiaceae bacterium]|nr:MucB/RseB C-terminal domain-containing protein [Casimicrobiaceae bacterium]